jgi:hypothetical protein
VTRVVTPRVEMYGRQHFGVADDVADFPGIELENNGGVGTVGSHWERRVMGTEMMTGTVKVRHNVCGCVPAGRCRISSTR